MTKALLVLKGCGLRIASNNDVVAIAGNLYLKTPTALLRVTGNLKSAGYSISNQRLERTGVPPTITVTEMISLGWPLWTATFQPGFLHVRKQARKDKGAEGKVLRMPSVILLYESWHWSPLLPSESLYLRVLRSANKEVLPRQDTTGWFSDESWYEMAKFVRHFTTLNYLKFLSDAKKFPRSSERGAQVLQQYCSQPNE